MAKAGAPRDGDRFVNLVGPRNLPGFPTMLGFFLRKTWRAMVSPPGGARLVPFDRQAMARNPSVTWIGHSTMLVRMDGVTFLTDPIFSERASPIAFAGPKRLVPPGVPLEALPPIDFVLLSHDHYDHTDIPSIEALAKRGARFIVPLGMGELVRSAGGEAVELDWWQHDADRAACVYPACRRNTFRGAPPSAAPTSDCGPAGWSPAQRAASITPAIPATSRASPRSASDWDRSIWPRLPIGAYRPRSIMHFVHLNPEEAIQAAVDLGANRVVAMHYGTFDLTEEPPSEPPRRFRRAAAQRGFDSDRAWTLNVGESRRLVRSTVQGNGLERG